jgi:hypothetical protein
MRRARRLKRYLTAFFLGAAVLAVAVWSALPALVERSLRERLQAAGFSDVDLNVTAVGLSEARIDGLRLGPGGGITAGEVIASYDAGDLMGVRLERLVVRNLRISVRLDSSGLSIDGLRPTGGTTGGFVDAGFLRSLPPVAIENGRIELATMIGAVALPFQGTVSPKPDGTAEAVLAVQLDSPDVEGRGRLDLTLAPNALGADLAIESGVARIAGMASTAFSGQARLDWAAAGRPQLSADIQLAETAVADVGFPTGTLAIDAGESRWSARLALAGPDGSSSVDADLVVADPYAQPRLDAAAKLTATADAWIWPALGLPQPQGGEARFDIRLAGPLPEGLPEASATKPGEMLRVLAAGHVEGTADIVLGNLAFPDLATIASATGRVDIRAADGSLTIAAQSAPSVAATLAPALLKSLDMPAGLSGRLAGPWTAELDLVEPLRLVTGESRTAASAAFGLQLAAESGDTIALRFEGRSDISDGLEVVASDGRLHVTGTLADVTVGRLTAAGIDLDVGTAIAKTGDRLSIRIVEPGTLTARTLAGSPLAGKIKALVLPLEPNETPLAAIDLSDGAPLRVTYSLQLGAIKATAPLLLGGSKPVPVAIDLAKTAFSGNWSAEAGHDGTVRVVDGALALPSLDLSARGIEAEIALGPDGSSADVRAAAIAHSGKPALMVPLALFGRADVAGAKASFTGSLRDKAKHIDLSIAAEHALDTGKGRAKVTMPPLVFEPGRLQPHHIVPAIGSEVEDVTGEAAIGGSVSWNAGKLTPKLELLLKDVSFRSPQFDVLRLNSVAEIDSLVPFTTRPGQQLSAGLLDVGLPLTDMLATFRIEPGPRLMVETARLSLAGGEVTLPPVALDLVQPHADLTLAVSNVDLAKLLELAEIEGLTATGALTGKIPIAIQADDLLIRDAVLAATGPGTLRYAPSTAPSALLGGGESVALALQALSNFQYSDLTLTVNRAAGGDTVALMQVKGRNPDFYGGHPVEFNLNISGKLDQILNRGLAGYRIPDTIRDRLGDFAQ